MKVAYIAGPYRGVDDFEVDENIAQARFAAIELWNKGYAVICPHMNTAHMEHYGRKYGIRDWVWLDGGLELVRRSDILVLVKGWEYSEGSRLEMNLADLLGKEVYIGTEAVPDAGEDFKSEG